MEDKYVNLLLLPKFLRDYDKASQTLRHAKEKRHKLLDRHGSFNKYNKLNNADRRCHALQEQCDECKKAITDLIIDDNDWAWDKAEITIVDNILNVYYGKGDAYGKGHGHYIINLSKNRIIYHRPLNMPHGSQNYRNQQENTSN